MSGDPTLPEPCSATVLTNEIHTGHFGYHSTAFANKPTPFSSLLADFFVLYKSWRYCVFIVK